MSALATHVLWPSEDTASWLKRGWTASCSNCSHFTWTCRPQLCPLSGDRCADQQGLTTPHLSLTTHTFPFHQYWLGRKSHLLSPTNSIPQSQVLTTCSWPHTSTFCHQGENLGRCRNSQTMGKNKLFASTEAKPLFLFFFTKKKSQFQTSV